ncbi:unnamed protein product [Rotaria sp. Silwood2]|nr:unnamed protein product [Rotaria sp. Silwood2]
MPLLAEGNETTSILNSSLRRSINNLTTLRSWREISFEDINKYEYIQILMNENLIDRVTTSIYECKFQSLSQDDNNKTILYAHIFIPANYPQARSIILLKLLLSTNGNKTTERTRANSENIKILERSLMCDIVYSPMTSMGSSLNDPSQHFTLLAQQIWRLSIGFPLLIDAESDLTCTSRRRQTLLSRLAD